MWKLALPGWQFIARAKVVYIFLSVILGRPQVIVHGHVYRC